MLKKQPSGRAAHSIDCDYGGCRLNYSASDGNLILAPMLSRPAGLVRSGNTQYHIAMPEEKRIFRTQDVPRAPGVYVYRNAAGEVIYVGKARNLRSRMSSYFQASALTTADAKKRALIHSIASYEIFQVATESEALLLETQFIKQYAPRYNVLMRDDKRFLNIRIDMSEPFPRLKLARIRRDDGCLYFGPFPQAQALRATVDFLSKHFGLRTCNAHSPSAEDHLHCLEHIVRACPCPCTGKISAVEYNERLMQAINVFRGLEGAQSILKELQTRMESLAAEMKFEEAAEVRDIMTNLKTIIEPARRFVNQTMITRHATNNREGMEALAQALEMKDLPHTMECFDMSNISGVLAVGSMVCFKEGKPSSSDYRRFKIRSGEAADDTAFMSEVLTRRYGRLLREKLPLPDLIVLDGGKPQVNAATNVFREIGLEGIPYIGLAKKMETIVFPDGRELLLEHDNKGLRLLQAIRDEAHRFANGFNRELRSRRIYNSRLDDIPGIGKVKKEQLLKAFGSVTELQKHSPEEIAEKVPGIGKETAGRILDFLNK